MLVTSVVFSQNSFGLASEILNAVDVISTAGKLWRVIYSQPSSQPKVSTRKMKMLLFTADKLWQYTLLQATGTTAPVQFMIKKLQGKLFGDKEYIFTELFQKLWKNSIQLIAGICKKYEKLYHVCYGLTLVTKEIYYRNRLRQA